MAKFIDQIIFAGILIAVLVSPWLFGSVEFYAIDLLTAILLVLLLLWSVKAALEKRLALLLTPIHWLLLAFVVFALVQSVALGLELHRAAFGQSPNEIVTAGSGALSMDPSTTKRAAMKLAMLVGYFFLATNFITGSRRFSITIIALILLGFSLALVATIHKFTSNGLILWFREVESIEVAFGPFANRNHFAGFLEMLMPLPLALIVAKGVQRDKWILYGFLTIALGTALVLSASRGALVVLAIQLFALPVLAVKQRELQINHRLHRFHGEEDLCQSVKPVVHRSVCLWLSRFAAPAIIAIGILLGVIWIGAEPVVSRFSSTPRGPEAPLANTLSRPAIWKNTLRMIGDNFLFGVGLGAYPMAYPRYDDSSGVYRVEQAHNDYLQIIADAGLFGVALLIAFIIMTARLAARALAQTTPVERSLALGGTLGCLGMAIHSFFDFNLQVTSNALLFLLLVALLAKLGTEEMRNKRQETRSKRQEARRKRTQFLISGL